MSKRKLGVIGGTFDPIHIGHLQLAQSVYEHMGLEKVLFVPAYIAPHKLGQRFAPAEDRYEMTRLAVQDKPHFNLTDMELRRSGVSYTIDTVKELKTLYTDCELFFIIGEDTVTQLHTWHRVRELLQMVTFVAAGRPGYDGVMELVEKNLGVAAVKKIILLDTPEYDVSSTKIREYLRCGKALTGLVPSAVESYIRQRGLYGATEVKV